MLDAAAVPGPPDHEEIALSGMRWDRREVLLAMSAGAALGTLGGARGARAQQVKWSGGTELPKLKTPAYTCDCHCQFYDSRYPVDPKGIQFPGDALAGDYRALQHRLGIARQVIVTPSAYGTDNRITLEALAEFGAQARAVVVVNETISDAALRQMHEQGVRGIRFSFAPAGEATTPEMIEPLSHRVDDLGWHVEINVWAAEFPQILPILERVRSTIVLSHFGHVPEPEGASDPLFGKIRGLIDKGKTWVKLAAPYDATKIGPPTYADSSALARAYVKAAPERLVWGTNWPHPGEDPKPDDALLFDLLLDWAPDEGVRNRILVDNPIVLYGFPKST
jgi:predicted TIM-barrel fold metal-dependent hydrolase